MPWSFVWCVWRMSVTSFFTIYDTITKDPIWIWADKRGYFRHLSVKRGPLPFITYGFMYLYLLWLKFSSPALIVPQSSLALFEIYRRIRIYHIFMKWSASRPLPMSRCCGSLKGSSCPEMSVMRSISTSSTGQGTRNTIDAPPTKRQSVVYRNANCNCCPNSFVPAWTLRKAVSTVLNS